MAKNISRASNWTFGNLGNFVLLVGWAASFALPAWAVRAAHLFIGYSPASWVIAGFLGALLAAIGYRILATARARWVKAKYDNTMMLRGGLVDPLAKTFERKRIYLSEFALPSHPWIEGKTFIDCDIIGPANLCFVQGNTASENRLPYCDAICMKDGDFPYNASSFRDCTFRGCSFQRITFLIPFVEYQITKSVEWLHWLGTTPDQPFLPFNATQTQPATPAIQESDLSKTT